MRSFIPKSIIYITMNLEAYKSTYRYRRNLWNRGIVVGIKFSSWNSTVSNARINFTSLSPWYEAPKSAREI